VLITELDMTTTEFLGRPQAGCFRSNIPLTTVNSVAPTIAASQNLINIQTSGRETQRSLRGIGGDLSLLTIPIYEAFQAPRTYSSSSRPIRSKFCPVQQRPTVTPDVHLVEHPGSLIHGRVPHQVLRLSSTMWFAPYTV
jgi:hypothetical protein